MGKENSNRTKYLDKKNSRHVYFYQINKKIIERREEKRKIPTIFLLQKFYCTLRI